MQLQIDLWPFNGEVPREVQLRALAAGKNKEGFAYFMRQRLGKTWVAYAEYINLRSENKVDWCVIICPNSLKDQWVEAIEMVDQFTPILVYRANNKSKTDYFFFKNQTGGVFIINYESVKAFMSDKGWEKINIFKTFIVADESTKIKDPTAKMTKACHEFASLCPYKRILTGKPTANSNADMWAQLKFINATNRNFYQHKYYFCVMGGYQGRTVVQNINTEILQAEIAPHCYIAEDKYIKGFEKIYEPIRRITLTEEQQKQYKQMEDELITEIANGVKITAPIALTKYLRLQQISSGIAGDPDGTQHNIISPVNNPRIIAIRDILDNDIDHKVVISCRFRLSIDNLQKLLIADGYKVSILIGNMGKEIEEQKKLFNEGENNILIGQEQVLAYGHTLCATDENPCDSIIFYENSFSLLNRAQVESRTEKLGREKPISYYDFYASKMDRYIIEALRRKEDAALALMGYPRSYGIRPDPL